MALPPVAAGPAREADTRPVLDELVPADLGRLTLGFQFAFWGTLLVLVALCESLTVLSLRPLDILLLGAGAVGMLAGSWRLHQVKALGDAWRRRTREALIVAGLVTYLSPFFVMWRGWPTNLYLLGHGLGLIGVFYFWLALMCQMAGTLGRAAGRRGLVVQAIGFGAISVVLLFPSFGVFVQAWVSAARSGSDPVVLTQFWLQRTPAAVVLVLLVPFPLTLSLVWSAKDVAMDRLLDRKR